VLLIPIEAAAPSEAGMASSAAGEMQGRDLTKLEGALQQLGAVPKLVHVLPLLNRSTVERAVVLLSRLVMLPGGEFAAQYVESGGLAKKLLHSLLDTTNRPGLIADTLIIMSMLARGSKDYYGAIHKADAYQHLLQLLQSSDDPMVRARVCNLVGNMCRHSDFFYAPLQKNGIIAEVIRCASDKDPNTRKFACFALGNAAFHSPDLYDTLQDAIGALIACLSEPVDKTRSNAAGALGNLVRNSEQLAPALAKTKAVDALIKASDPKFDAAGSSSRVALYSLGTVVAYAPCKEVLKKSGFEARLKELVKSKDKTTTKYATRVLDRMRG